MTDRLTPEDLDKSHGPLCGVTLKDGECSCLVHWVEGLQAEVDELRHKVESEHEVSETLKEANQKQYGEWAEAADERDKLETQLRECVEVMKSYDRDFPDKWLAKAQTFLDKLKTDEWGIEEIVATLRHLGLEPWPDGRSILDGKRPRQQHIGMVLSSLKAEVEKLKELDRDNLARLESNAQQRDAALSEVEALKADYSRVFILMKTPTMDGSNYAKAKEIVRKNRGPMPSSTVTFPRTCAKCGERYTGMLPVLDPKDHICASCDGSQS